ncbi:hypothetical protein Fmac_016610 [Flemingia macrophylla]|uniref:Uncharacterized protein n=1 Tax=Flemingia macrophylla TaxID=520843 RepID=A0ABD1MHX4_9FABA
METCLHCLLVIAKKFARKTFCDRSRGQTRQLIVFVSERLFATDQGTRLVLVLTVVSMLWMLSTGIHATAYCMSSGENFVQNLLNSITAFYSGNRVQIALVPGSQVGAVSYMVGVRMRLDGRTIK